MALKSEPFYWLICDTCGVKSTEGGDYGAWSDAQTAVEDAENSDWWTNDPWEHFCPEHVPCDGSDNCPAFNHTEGCFCYGIS